MATTQYNIEYYIDTAHELAEKVASKAKQIDEQRQIPSELASEFAEKGFFRLLQPSSYGGAQLDHPNFLKILEIFADADGSTSWCINQNNVHATNILRMTPEAAEEIYSDDKAVVTNGPPASSVRAIHCDGGYQITGRWNFSSGITHATWVAARAPIVLGDREEHRIFLIPKNEVKFVDFWPVHGLRGTASFSFETDDLFVPQHRVYDPNGTPCQDGPVFRIPTTLLFATGFSTVALGIAKASLNTAMNLAGNKVPGRAVRLLKDETTTQRIIGEAEAVWFSAKAFLREAHESVWETVARREHLTTEKRVMLRLAATFGIQKAKEVVDTAYDLCGSNAILDTNPILRRFQDIHVVSQHIQGRSSHFETAGQFFMGMQPEGNF